VFLARGIGPLTVAYGNGPVGEHLGATVGKRHSHSRNAFRAPALGGTELRRTPSKTLPWKTSILWATLLAGVALLVTFAYRLSKG